MTDNALCFSIAAARVQMMGKQAGLRVGNLAGNRAGCAEGYGTLAGSGGDVSAWTHPEDGQAQTQKRR